MSTAIDHLSHSQVTTFVSCPRKWRYEKIDHAPRERTPAALAFGIAIHDAAAQVNEAALVGDSVDGPAAFVKAWTEQVAQAQAPIHYGKDDADDLMAKGRGMLAIYQPPAGIVGVEQPFSVILDPDLPPVEGRIDLITRTTAGDLALADLKSAGTKTLTDTTAAEAQLALYQVAYPAKEHAVIVLGKLKTPTVTTQAITPLPHATLVRHYREVYAAMRSGTRYAVRGWHCDGCPFATRCAKET